MFLPSQWFLLSNTTSLTADNHYDLMGDCAIHNNLQLVIPRVNLLLLIQPTLEHLQHCMSHVILPQICNAIKNIVLQI